MQDLPTRVLQELDKAGQTDSLQLATSLGVDDVQRVVGAIKSLEALGDVVSAELYQIKRWQLTQEGREVFASGSPEAKLYQLVPISPQGINQSELMALCGGWGKIGFSKAMSSGWIQLDKSEGNPVVKRKVESISDKLQTHLALIQAGQADSVEDKLKSEYKKRRMLEEVTEKHYRLRKGANFSTRFEKAPADLTPEMISTGAWRSAKLKAYNLNALGVDPAGGCLHPLLKVRAEYRQIFLEMGFSEMPANNFVESSFWNFDALFQPQQHPARDAHDTFFISDPATSNRFPTDYKERVEKVHSKGGFGSQGYGYDWKIEEASKNLLRTHTTAVSARMLYRVAQENKFVPQKLFSIDRVFRNETLDATHLAEFHQIEGVVADYGLTLGHCIGIINTFFTKLGIEKLRFKPAYNPYTEPSMEIFSYHEGLGKWVEIGNSGMFRPEMLLPMGLPEGVNVIGFGLSLERPTMIKYKIDNIRDLVGHKVNLGMVKQNPICRIDKSGNSEERRIQHLNKRFDRIESRLEFIQQKMQALGVKSMAQSTTGGSSLSGVNSSASSTDIIIKAHPSRPPFSVDAMLKLVCKSFSVSTSTHTHSSVEKPGSYQLPVSDVTRSGADLRLTLIYTNVDNTSLLCRGTEVKGEENVLRYITRMLDTRTDCRLYETLGLQRTADIDNILDRLSDSSKHNVTSLVSGLVAKQSFLVGEELTLADLLGLSLCTQQKISSPAIQNWAKRLRNQLQQH